VLHNDLLPIAYRAFLINPYRRKRDFLLYLNNYKPRFNKWLAVDIQVEKYQ